MPTEEDLLKRIMFDPTIYGGKPIVRGRRLAVEHVLGMIAAGTTQQEILDEYDWLEPEDVQACLLYAYKLVAREIVEERPTREAS